MKHVMGLIWMSFLLSLAGIGCIGSDSTNSENSETTGKLALPLVVKQPSGTIYRLTDAVFDIIPTGSQYYSDLVDGGVVSERDEIAALVPVVVYSDDQPGATAIHVNLESGQYLISLRSGWRMEKIVRGMPTPVVATLISSTRQWSYINPRRTTKVVFDFRVDGRSIRDQGALDIGINVLEDAGTADASW